jgi:hypothetical protein
MEDDYEFVDADKAKGLSFTEYISQEPSDYFKESDFTNNIAIALFRFYEEHEQEIYNTIQEDNPEIVIPVDNQDPDAALIAIFENTSEYNKDRIFLKFKQEIQCVSTNPVVESYIEQSKKDWHRSSFYSSKYNKYYEKYVNENKGKTDKVMPYLSNTPASDKLFLITADAINNYFMTPYYSPSLQINNSENIDARLGEIDCDCEKIADNSLICASFNRLEIPNDQVKKILYNLSFINQAQKSEIMRRFNHLINIFAREHEDITLGTVGDGGSINYNLGEGVGYYFLDEKNKSFVYFNTLILIVELPESDVFFVPLYKVMSIFPFEMSDYYYTCLYVDNEMPSMVGNTGRSWFGKKEPVGPVTANYYQFLAEKINWYMKKYRARNSDFKNGKYMGADYLNYQNKRAEEYKKLHKSYKYTYKSPKFVPPEQVLSRLLGGRIRTKKTRRTRKLYKRKKTKAKKTRAKTRAKTRRSRK